MADHSSATVRGETPHADRTTRTNTIINALKRRAQAVLSDRSIDAQSRAIIRYALETNDPWLAELVRRADAGEAVVDQIDFSQEPRSSASSESSGEDNSSESKEEDSTYEKIETLAEMICRAGDEARTKSAALLVLMATLENAKHPKALLNVAKHVAFTNCGELDLNMVNAQIAVLESELFAGEMVEC